uniref:SP110 n=1 Tax=Cricetulus griseus TaxID=10029 RepID=A0A8C2LQV4_CRIGR
MLTVTNALKEALLQHFIYTKLDIAYAINKPFPFFEALRDNSFITEKMYKESLQACQNLVPLSKVVHNVLTSLERTFQPSLLMILFSQVNLREYPSLAAIFRSFKNVRTAYEENKRTAHTLPKAPTDPAEGHSFRTLLPLPPPEPSPPSHLSSAPRVCEPREASHQITEILDEQPSPSHTAVPPPGFIREGKTTAESSRDPPRNDKDDSTETPPSPSGSIPVKDESPAPNDLELPQEAPSTPANKKAKKKKRCIWSTPKRRHQKKRPPQVSLGPGVASPGLGVQEKLKVVGQRTPRKGDSTRTLKMVTRSQMAKTKRAQTSRSQEVINGASKTNGIRRPQRMPSLLPKTTQGKSNDDTADFLSPILPVTCGKVKGILFKEKMKQGPSGKCIQNEAGDLLTPREFLIKGGKARSKDWKKTIWCKGKTLRFLEQKGLLLCTSNSNLKKRVT